MKSPTLVIIAFVLVGAFSPLLFPQAPPAHQRGGITDYPAVRYSPGPLDWNGSFPFNLQALPFDLDMKVDAAAVGDVNGDGLPDALFSSYLNESVSVHLNRNGILNVTPDAVIGPSSGLYHPTDVEIIGGDIAVACHNDSASPGTNGDAVLIYNLSDLSSHKTLSSPALSTSNPITLTSLAVGDFNSDGYEDIAAAFSTFTSDFTNGSEIAIYYGPPTDGQTADKWIRLGDNVTRIISGDFDGDGADDLAAIVDDGKLVVVYYQRNGAIDQNDASYHPQDSAVYLARGDLDGDGQDELLVSNVLNGTVSIYHSSGSELPRYPEVNISSSPGAYAIAVGDFNSDGSEDVIVSFLDSRLYGGQLDMPHYMNIYNGPFEPGVVSGYSRRIFAGYMIRDLSTVDFNDDGMDDLLVCASGDRYDFPSVPYALYQRDGYLKGISDESLYGAVYPTGIAMADFNGDGLNDIAVAATAINKTLIFYNRGYTYPVFADAAINVSGYPYYIAPGFLDSDNLPDFAVTHALDGNVTVFSSVSYSTINLTTNMNTTYRVVIGDVDGDGTDDVVVNSYDDPEIDIFLSGSGLSDGVAPSENITLPAPSVDVAIVHLENDSLPGIAVLYEDRMQIFEQSTAGNFTLKETVPIDTNYVATAMAIGDFNGDGLDDIVTVATYKYGKASAYGILLQDNGTFPTTPQYSGFVPGYAYSITTGDFSDDGLTDFAIPTTMNLVILGYFTGSDFIYDYLATNMNPVHVGAADLNGDGKDDLVVSSHGPSVDNLPIEEDMVDVYYQKDYPPYANISGPNSTYEGEVVEFNADNSTDTVSDRDSLNYTWYVYNGTSWELMGYGYNVTYVFPTQGNYTVALEVRDKEGLSSHAFMNVTVLDTAPKISVKVMGGTEGENTTFIANVTAYDGVSAIYWDMESDGVWDFENVTQVNYTYDTQGEYNVTVMAIDGDGSRSTYKRTVRINDTAPTCDFTYSPDVIYEGTPVHFVASWNSYDPVVNWTWDFGNSLMYGSEVNYSFPSQGNYEVVLTVRDSDGSTSSASRNVLVMDTQPVVNFTYTGVYEGTPFHFRASVESYDPIAEYFWDFGDGSFSNEENPTHVFAENGTYFVTLYVNDSDGSNVSYTVAVEVEDVDPEVTFTHGSAVEGVAVQFHANVSSYDGITYLRWDFGDGSFSNEENPTHVFAENGTYRVTITVREADGDEASFSETIVVQDTVPDVRMKIDGPSVVNEDEAVVFNASGTTAYDGIKEYLWDFNYVEGHFSADASTTVPLASTTFPEMGTYTVALMVIDGDGSASYAFVQVTVNNVDPVANFTFTVRDNVVTVDASPSYDTPSDRESLIYTWDFGDGSPVVHGMTAQHRYTKPGKYTITLTVEDNDGAKSTITRVVEIRTVPPSHTGASSGIWYVILFLIPVIGGLAAILLYMRGKKVVIDDVYLISDSGLLIHHATRRLKPDMDEDILSSMLVAIQEFVKDAFKGEDDVALKSMDFGDKKISIHKGKHLYLAVVSNRNVPRKLEEKIARILEEIEEKYGKVLESWDGDVRAFRGVEEILKKIWE